MSQCTLVCNHMQQHGYIISSRYIASSDFRFGAEQLFSAGSGVGVPACCGLHGCLCHRLGCHVHWACSVRGVNGPPTALAHQLPRFASSIPCPELPERALTGQACAGPYRQHCDRCVHQPSRWSALPSQKEAVSSFGVTW